jgi:integrase/recombinase XerD
MKLSLEEVADVAAHVVRDAPYWHTLEFCRHIGVHKRSDEVAYWVARIRTKKGTYLQKRIAPTTCSSTAGIPLPEAIKAARAWFSSPGILSCSADSYPCGARAELLYCPYGDVFTVGHALKDYIEWKRIAATQSHFETNLSLINYHILQRLGHIPLDEFTGRHLSAFCLEVLQTPPKRGAQKIGPLREISSLDSEQLRKRKKTLNALIGILRLAFQLAWENGETDNERAWRCLRRLPNVDRPRVIALTRDECSELVSACSNALRPLVLAALYSGCRVGELTRLCAGEVGQHGFGIHVLPSKNYRPRFVFLPDEGMAFFLSMTEGRGSRDLVFTNSAVGPWGGGYRHLFKSAVVGANPRISFLFRYGFAKPACFASDPGGFRAARCTCHWR